MENTNEAYFYYKLIIFDLLDEDKNIIKSYNRKYNIVYINGTNYIKEIQNIKIDINCNYTKHRIDDINFRFHFNEDKNNFSIINTINHNGHYNICIYINDTKKYIFNYNITKFIDKTFKKNPLISVVIPIHNLFNYMKKGIHSIVNQTIQDFEIILVRRVRRNL